MQAAEGVVVLTRLFFLQVTDSENSRSAAAHTDRAGSLRSAHPSLVEDYRDQPLADQAERMYPGDDSSEASQAVCPSRMSPAT